MDWLQPSLIAYIAEPNTALEIPIVSEKFCRAVVDMTRPTARLYCVRRSAVKRALDALSSIDRWGKVRFTTAVKSTVQAYMRENGEICMSYGAFVRSCGANFTLMFCHELAHVWLSRTDGYGKLKALDKLYRTTFDKLPNVVDTSPIEYLASSVCIRLLRATADITSEFNKKYSDMLRNIADKELSKAATLRNIIVSLQIAAE